MRKLKDYALFLLSRRDYSAKELTDRLSAKGYESLEVESLVAEFKEKRWLDEKRFAESYVRRLITARKSRRQIEYALKLKGVDEEVIRDIVKKCCNSDSEMELISILIERYLRSGRPVERAKLAKRLASRGFDLDAIRKCLDKAFE